MTQKTLADYINFLRENHYAQEANFYNTTVVNLLKSYGCASPLDMSTEDVIAKLYELNDALNSALADSKAGQWDGDLDG